MPAFKLGNRVLVYYAAFKDHLSLFPASGSVMEKLGSECSPISLVVAPCNSHRTSPFPTM